MEERHSAHQHSHPRWWLGGEEMCEFCAQYYSLELEYRCVDCDRPICPICVVTIRERQGVVCPECQHSGADET